MFSTDFIRTILATLATLTAVALVAGPLTDTAHAVERDPQNPFGTVNRAHAQAIHAIDCAAGEKMFDDELEQAEKAYDSGNTEDGSKHLDQAMALWDEAIDDGCAWAARVRPPTKRHEGTRVDLPVRSTGLKP
jgi:hypothetical protein